MFDFVLFNLGVFLLEYQDPNNAIFADEPFEGVANEFWIEDVEWADICGEYNYE